MEYSMVARDGGISTQAVFSWENHFILSWLSFELFVNFVLLRPVQCLR